MRHFRIGFFATVSVVACLILPAAALADRNGQNGAPNPNANPNASANSERPDAPGKGNPEKGGADNSSDESAKAGKKESPGPEGHASAGTGGPGNAGAAAADERRSGAKGEPSGGNGARHQEDPKNPARGSGDADREPPAGRGNPPGRAGSPGRSAEAQHHVIICHRTASGTNPYVVINISVRAWRHGHQTHPPIDGRSDVLLKDPARPGEKMPASACPAPTGGGSSPEGGGGGGGTSAGDTTAGETTGSNTSASSSETTATASRDEISTASSSTATSEESVSRTQGERPAVLQTGLVEVPSRRTGSSSTWVVRRNSKAVKGVSARGQAMQGATAPSGGGEPARSSDNPKRGAVLGAVADRNLPYTGVPLWLTVLAGMGLLAAGLVARRRALLHG